jgi:hypothetical protein
MSDDCTEEDVVGKCLAREEGHENSSDSS